LFLYLKDNNMTSSYFRELKEFLIGLTSLVSVLVLGLSSIAAIIGVLILPFFILFGDTPGWMWFAAVIWAVIGGFSTWFVAMKEITGA